MTTRPFMFKPFSSIVDKLVLNNKQ